MEEQYARYLDQGVESLFIYIREAHPNKDYPQPTSYEQRLEHARQLRERDQDKRPILIDPIDNPTWARYGYMSNMAYVMSNRGIVMYRCSWTRPYEIEEVVENLLRYPDGSEVSTRTADGHQQTASGRTMSLLPIVISERALHSRSGEHTGLPHPTSIGSGRTARGTS